jgi:hypothetical protein
MAVKSQKLRILVLERDNFRCKFCGATSEQERLEVDHILPEALGGTDSLNNLATLCQPCNRGKSKQYFGNYMLRVIDEQLSQPRVRSALRPPVDYQVSALRQFIEHLKRSGISKISLSDFARVVQTGGLRDGINPLFEPLSFATVTEGIDQMLQDNEITAEGDYFTFPVC